MFVSPQTSANRRPSGDQAGSWQSAMVGIVVALPLPFGLTRVIGPPVS